MTTTWQWAAYLNDEVRANSKIPLLINIDESPMPLMYGDAVGNIERRTKKRNADREPRRAATRNDTRVHYTFIAMICNIPWIQELLPQILIVPARALPESSWLTVASRLPQNVYLLRNNTMWVSSKIWVVVLRLLRKSLKRLRIQRTYKVILFADAFGGHITVASMQAMKKYRFWFVLLPAGLTWLMQPLDVQAFVQVKRFLKARFMSLESATDPVRIVVQALLDCVAAVEEFFTTRDWSQVFDVLGLNGTTPPTSKHFLKELDWNVIPDFPRTRPTAQLIRKNTPRGRELNPAALAGCLPDLPEASPAHGGVSPAPAGAAAAAPGGAAPAPAPGWHRRRLPATFANVDLDSSSE